MSLISITEDAIIAALKAAYGKAVRGVDALPGQWDDDTLKRLVRLMPGAYVAFTGGQPSAPNSKYAQIDSIWSVYVATAHANGEAARRRGDKQQVGAYELAETAMAAVHGLKVADVGTLYFTGIENLYTGTIDQQGIAIYAVNFTVPFTVTPATPTNLGTFRTFDGRWDIPPETPDQHRAWLDGDLSKSRPDAEDVVELPQ